MWWVLKACLQKGLSSLPGSSRANYFFQRRITKSLPASDGVLKRRMATARHHLDLLSQYGACQDLAEAKFYEFGAGWDLVIPLAYFYLGVRNQTVIDIQRLVFPELIADSVRRLGNYFASPDTSPDLHLAEDFDVDKLVEWGIHYVAPCDARDTKFSPYSFDFISNTSVLEHILAKVQLFFPADSTVVLLGGAEYNTCEMLACIEQHTVWQYVLRTSPQIHVQEGGASHAIGDYPLAKGQVFQYSQVGYTQAVPVTVHLISWWSARYDSPLYLITNLSQGYRACKYYQRRLEIEKFFLDQKSRGFQIHKSHLSDPARLSRLLLSACLAYVGVICQGLQVIAKNQTGWIDRADRTDKSLFWLGLDWIHYALRRNLDFEPLFHLQFSESLLDVR